MNAWIAAPALIAGLIGAGGLASVVVKWMDVRAAEKSGSRENALIDQLQEENANLIARVTSLEANQRTLVGYVYELYAHIADGKPPPPPPMPDLT